MRRAVAIILFVPALALVYSIVSVLATIITLAAISAKFISPENGGVQ